MTTMHKRIFVAVLIVVGLLSLWWLTLRKPLQRSIVVAQTHITPTHDVSSTSAATDWASKAQKPQPGVPDEVQERRFAMAFKTPIVFYGRVVDQHGVPVPSAAVRMTAVDKPWQRPSIYGRKTDSSGMFSVKDIVGLDLSVEVSKPGYHVIPAADNRVTSSGIFNYGLSHPHRPNQDAPVVFTLQKMGTIEPLMKTGKRNFRITRDGLPLLIEVDKQGAHHVVLRCWNQELSRPTAQRQYDWKLEINVPNGGLLARNDAFSFEAPQDGYAPSDIIDMPASLPYAKWDSFAERSYFIRFGDGTFARANLEMHAGGDHFVVWESFFNPKVGSRNLESGAPDETMSR